MDQTREFDADAIELMRESGIVSGYEDGRFRPSQVVNRAEWAKVLIEGMGNPSDASAEQNCFPDVQTEWFAKYICYGQERGYWQGRPDGKFHPADPVNLMEALKMVQGVLGIETETAHAGEQWFEPYKRAAQELNVIYEKEANAPTLPLTRALMARLFVRTSFARAASQPYTDGLLRSLREEKGTLKDILSSTLTAGAFQNGDLGYVQNYDWLLKIHPDGSASSFRKFSITYAHHPVPFEAYEGVSPEVFILPTISIEEKTGIAHLGLDGDAQWEGIATPATQQVEVDADTSGPEPASQNLRYDVRGRIVVITSTFGSQRGEFNLATGTVKGDRSITRGYSSLKEYFRDHHDEPFTVCVSDRPGYEGEVGIFADYATVGVRPCKREFFGPKPAGMLEAPKPYPSPLVRIGGGGASSGGGGGGGGDKPLIRIGGGGGTSGGGGGTRGGGNGGGGVLIGGLGKGTNENGKQGGGTTIGRTTGKSGGEGKSTTSGGQKLPNHPGKGYSEPSGRGRELRRRADELKKDAENGRKLQEEQTANVAKNREAHEALAEYFGVELPAWAPPSIGSLIAKCCPGSQPKSCCDSTDLCSDDGYAAYLKRLGCLQDAFNEVIREMATLTLRLNFLLGRLPGLEKAEGHFRQLGLQKKIFEAGIDALMGGEGAKQFFRNILGEVVDSLLSGTGVVPREFGKEEYPDEAMKEFLNQYMGKIGGAGAVIDAVAEKLADLFHLSGRMREKFQNTIHDRFAESPKDLADPATWVKLFTSDVLMGSLGEDFIAIVERMRQERDDAIRKLYELDMLYQAYVDALASVRKACAGDACGNLIEQAEEEDRKDQAIVDRYRQDAEGILDLLESFLTDTVIGRDLMSDHPDAATLKQRLIQRLKLALRDMGYDDCWFDIEFDIEVTYDDAGNVSWHIKNCRFIKRSEPRPNCPEPIDDTYTPPATDAVSSSRSSAPLHEAPPPQRESSSDPYRNKFGYDGTILLPKDLPWYMLSGNCQTIVGECQDQGKKCARTEQEDLALHDRCLSLLSGAPDACSAAFENGYYPELPAKSAPLPFISIATPPKECDVIAKEYRKCEDEREGTAESAKCWKRAAQCTEKYKFQDCLSVSSSSSSSSSAPTILPRTSSSSSTPSAPSTPSTTLSPSSSSASSASAAPHFVCCEACPATDQERFYIPFAGDSCQPGDAQRNDLNEKSCANPLYENPGALPMTFGPACSAKPVGSFEFLSIDEDWKTVTDFPFGGPVHFVVASDGTHDVRRDLPIRIHLWVNNTLTYSLTFDGSPSDVCRGATGCSVDGPTIPAEWRGQTVRVEAYGKDGTLLSRFTHRP